MRVAALRVERIPLAGVAFWSGANLRTDQRDHRAKWFTIEFQMNFRISVSISKKKKSNWNFDCGCVKSIQEFKKN